MRIVGLFAHPDDAELWCGGTLHLHSCAGDAVRVLAFHCLSPERQAEARAGAQILGIDVGFLPAAEYEPPDALSTFNVLAVDPPDVVITHWMHDTHIEHRKVFAHALESVHRLKRHMKKTPLMLMTSTYFAMGSQGTFEPNVVCDISAVMDIKRAAIMAHTSQRPEALLDDVLTQNRLWGSRIAARYGEGFLEYPLFGFRHTTRRASLHDLVRAR
jgi:N-acetylglucosamine malate deacetylase 1